jgi:hypothetical protein
MAQFKLLGGMHIQADKSKPIKDADGKPTGRYEARVFRVGQVVESDADLVAKHGPNKFERLGGDAEAAHDQIRKLEAELAQARAQLGTQGGTFRVPGDPTPENLERSPAVFPGGQVSTGFQGSVGGQSTGGLSPHADAEPDFDSMKLAELKDYAATNEIDLGDAKHKDDVLAAVKKHRGK